MIRYYFFKCFSIAFNDFGDFDDFGCPTALKPASPRASENNKTSNPPSLSRQTRFCNFSSKSSKDEGARFKKVKLLGDLSTQARSLKFKV